MTITDLNNALNSVTINGAPALFKHFGWSSAPVGDYGVFSEDGSEFFVSDDRNTESTLTGTIDYFTRDDSGAPKSAIESALRSLQNTNAFAWNVNTIQYEQDTGYIHYEWAWEFL